MESTIATELPGLRKINPMTGCLCGLPMNTPVTNEREVPDSKTSVEDTKRGGGHV